MEKTPARRGPIPARVDPKGHAPHAPPHGPGGYRPLGPLLAPPGGPAGGPGLVVSSENHFDQVQNITFVIMIYNVWSSCGKILRHTLGHVSLCCCGASAGRVNPVLRHRVEKSKWNGTSDLKSPTISTLFPRPSEGVDKCDFRVLPGGGKKLMAFQTTKGVTAATHTP